MTEDRDFKQVVRQRSEKTGESYQASRRQVERQTAGLSARVGAMYAHPSGLVLGCIVDAGRLTLGMSVTVLAGDVALHRGTVASLRRGKDDQAVVTAGECGILLDPPFHGYLPIEADKVPEAAGALRPVVIGPAPDRVVG